MNKLEEIKKHIMSINDILLNQEKEEQNARDKVWVVYWLDSVGVLDRDTLRVFRKWEDAYKYYRDLAGNTLDSYKKNNERLKRPTVINDFTEKTYYVDSEYPEFWIDNHKDMDCHIWFEYEECILTDYFIS